MKHAINISTVALHVLMPLWVLLLQACGKHAEPAPPPDLGPVQVPRTVLVYMVANNSLGNLYDLLDISEMKDAARDGKLSGGRLLVYHSSSRGIVLKEVTAAGIDTLKVYDDSQLSVSIGRMSAVIDDMKQLAPADSYGLVLWSHSSAWLQDGIDDPADSRLRSYGYDGSSKNKMNITSLAQAVGRDTFSFIYFDCCYMGSVEVMYEMRHCAPYIVGSATEVPGDGMPYDQNMGYFFDTATPVADNMVAAARTTFEHYDETFDVEHGDIPCTMVVVRTDMLDQLAEATRNVYLDAPRLYDPLCNYQKFVRTVMGTCHYFDLDQYVESITPDDASLELWREALGHAVLYADAVPMLQLYVPIDRHCGLSTHIMRNPADAYFEGYDTLSWYQDVASALVN